MENILEIDKNLLDKFIKLQRTNYFYNFLNFELNKDVNKSITTKLRKLTTKPQTQKINSHTQFLLHGCEMWRMLIDQRCV